MSEIKKTAVDLLYAFVAAEKAIELAEQTIVDKREEKKALLEDINSHPVLCEHLLGPGVTCHEYVCKFSESGKYIELSPEPVGIFSLREPAADPEKSHE